jgi:hypothetical protein
LTNDLLVGVGCYVVVLPHPVIGAAIPAPP